MSALPPPQIVAKREGHLPEEITTLEGLRYANPPLENALGLVEYFAQQDIICQVTVDLTSRGNGSHAKIMAMADGAVSYTVNYQTKL